MTPHDSVDATWQAALRTGFRLVNKACLPGGAEADLRRGRLSAVALLMGASEAWIQSHLSAQREDVIQLYVHRRLH